jgi:hypothetical protein
MMSSESDPIALLAAEHRAAQAPLSIERAVLAEFETSRRQRRRGIAAVCTIAAMLVAGAFVVRERPARHHVTFEAAAIEKAPPRFPELDHVDRVAHEKGAPAAKPRPRKHSAVRTKNLARESAEEPFVAIPYTVPLAPEERTTVVRITLSPSAIAAVGFPLPAIDPGNESLADVLVGEDGRAHAIRIVADTSFK